MDTSFNIRPIAPADNATVAHIIRTVMTEFGAVGAGYSIEDPEVDFMYEAYATPQAIYLVVTVEDKVLGCGGIAPLNGGDAGTCELKKMYFLPELRGLGAGKKLITQLEREAAERGYNTIYLETIARMEQANHLYQKMGYMALPAQMGNTGHSSCGLYYAKVIR